MVELDSSHRVLQFREEKRHGLRIVPDMRATSLAASEVKTLRATADDPFVVAVGVDTFVLDSVTNGILDTNELDTDDAVDVIGIR